MKCIAVYECSSGIQRAVREDGATFSRYRRGALWTPWLYSADWTRRDIEANIDYHPITPTPHARLPK